MNVEKTRFFIHSIANTFISFDLRDNIFDFMFKFHGSNIMKIFDVRRREKNGLKIHRKSVISLQVFVFMILRNSRPSIGQFLCPRPQATQIIFPCTITIAQIKNKIWFVNSGWRHTGKWNWKLSNWLNSIKNQFDNLQEITINRHDI